MTYTERSLERACILKKSIKLIPKVKVTNNSSHKVSESQTKINLPRSDFFSDFFWLFFSIFFTFVSIFFWLFRVVYFFVFFLVLRVLLNSICLTFFSTFCSCFVFTFSSCGLWLTCLDCFLTCQLVFFWLWLLQFTFIWLFVRFFFKDSGLTIWKFFLSLDCTM